MGAVIIIGASLLNVSSGGQRRRGLPAAGKQNLSVHFYRGSAAKLTTNEIRVVRRVDVVVCQWFVHVLMDAEAVQEYRSVLIRHEIPAETVVA